MQIFLREASYLKQKAVSDTAHCSCNRNDFFNALLKCKHLLAAVVAVTYYLAINNQAVCA